LQETTDFNPWRNAEFLLRRDVTGCPWSHRYKRDDPAKGGVYQGTTDFSPWGSINPARISVYFGNKIFIEGGLSYEEIAHRVMDNIKHLSQERFN
jgi:hypothetical protein